MKTLPYLMIISILGLFFLQCSETKKDAVITTTKQKNTVDSLFVDQTHNLLPLTAEWTNRLEIADINGDFLPDLLFANGGDYSTPGEPEPLKVFINQGPELPFKEVTKNIFGEKKYLARVVKVSDLNNDGYPDILIGNTYQTQSEIWFGNEDYSFTNKTDSHLPQILLSVGDLEFGDTDGDGDLDIALIDWGPGNSMTNEGGLLHLWLNDGEGKFTNVTTERVPAIKIGFSWDIEFIDYDNDFDLDVFVSCKKCDGSKAFVNNGKGEFKLAPRLLPSYTNNYEFEAMDINMDGFLDLITINDGEIVDGKSYSRREHIFLSDSGRFFRDQTEKWWPDSVNIGEDDNNIFFFDFESDGDPDFMIASLTGNERIIINESTHFSLLDSVLPGDPTPHTLMIAPADINRDHKMDIIMAQGEGEENISERIYVGYNIQPDTAKPLISHYRIYQDSSIRQTYFEARIHDHKSPYSPLDWKKIKLKLDDQTSTNLSWYGEFLFRGKIDTSRKIIEVIAEDAAGNMRILNIN